MSQDDDTSKWFFCTENNGQLQGRINFRDFPEDVQQHIKHIISKNLDARWFELLRLHLQNTENLDLFLNKNRNELVCLRKRNLIP